MKVLHVISDTNIGGAGVLLCTLLRHFSRERIQSIVALPRDSALRERLEAIGTPMYFLQEPCDRVSWRSVREIREQIQEEAVDLVHANAAICARIAGRQCGIAVMHTRHCCFPPSGIWRLPPVRLLGGLSNRVLSDRVIATAEAAREDLLRLGIPNRKIEVIINGSEPIREVGEEEISFYRKQWDLQREDFTVGICARLVPCKGHDVFLKAAKEILTRLPNRRIRFLIAGEGESRVSLERLSEALGVSSAVRFLGFLADPAPFYRLLNINVNCSSGTETSCLALSEGMSAGVPMVVSDYGGNRAMVGDGAAGILYPTGNEIALADAVCQIATDPVFERSMRSAALQRYRSSYTAQGMTDRLMEVYESLINASASRS